MIKGYLIFDLVGTLVKSPPDSLKYQSKLKHLQALNLASERISEIEQSPVINVSEEFKARNICEPDFDVSGYHLRKDTIGVLKQLKSQNWSLVLGVNSAMPKKIRAILSLREEEVTLGELFDFVCISSEVGKAKPNPEFIFCALQGKSASEVFVIGDMLDTDILAAQKAQTKAVWLNASPSNPKRNSEAINSGTVVYPRTVTSLSLLESALEHYEPKGVRVGYILPFEDKKQSTGLKKCFESNSGFWYNAMEPRANLELQGEVQAIVHKVADYLSMNVLLK